MAAGGWSAIENSTISGNTSPGGEVREGALRKVLGFGVLKRAGMCFLKVTPVGKIHTWGIGVSLWQLLRDPVGADRSVEFR